MLTATVAQAEATPTPASIPASLPRTGGTGAPGAWLPIALALLLGGALALRSRRRSADRG